MTLYVLVYWHTAQDLAANSNVQDAFVIAVEKQARERLERLSALKKIKPVDMTKLSQQVRIKIFFSFFFPPSSSSSPPPICVRRSYREVSIVSFSFASLGG